MKKNKRFKCFYMDTESSANNKVNSFLENNPNIMIDNIVTAKTWMGIFYHIKRYKND